jgi:21S rRNA (uridine2791-2'-O)-methyltransferase
LSAPKRDGNATESALQAVDTPTITETELDEISRGYVDMERHAHLDTHEDGPLAEQAGDKQEVPKRQISLRGRDEQAGRVVDVVLSDMSAPWDQTTGFWQRSVTKPYHRMMNTSGIAFKDHAGSMVSEVLSASQCHILLPSEFSHTNSVKP